MSRGWFGPRAGLAYAGKGYAPSDGGHARLRESICRTASWIGSSLSVRLAETPVPGPIPDDQLCSLLTGVSMDAFLPGSSSAASCLEDAPRVWPSAARHSNVQSPTHDAPSSEDGKESDTKVLQLRALCWVSTRHQMIQYFAAARSPKQRGRWILEAARSGLDTVQDVRRREWTASRDVSLTKAISGRMSSPRGHWGHVDQPSANSSEG